MITRRALSWIGLILLSAGFLAVFGRVLEMRVSSGDIYPHYATLRNDPLGCSALFESFASMDGYRVEQNMKPLTSVKGIDGDTALLLLGLPWDSFDDLRVRDDSPVIRAVEDEGARLVITLNPQIVQDIFRKKKTEEEDDWIDRRRKLRDKLRREREEKKEDSENKEQKEEELDEEERELELEAIVNFGTKLGDRLAVEIPELEDDKRPENGWETKAGKTLKPGRVPVAVPRWFSQYRLQANDKAWKKVVLIDEIPVVLERRLGKGTVVLATDSYFTSNESLHSGGNPEFLLWLTGGKKHIVFDETIHGSTLSGGAMMLIRRYRLHGVFLGMFIFIGLWAWRSATSLTPGDEAVDRGLVGGSAVSGEQNNAGFLQLLKRSVPSKDLIAQCLDVWRKSQVSHINPEQEQQVSSILASHRADPKKHSVAETYRAISRALKKH